MLGSKLDDEIHFEAQYSSMFVSFLLLLCVCLMGVVKFQGIFKMRRDGVCVCVKF